jgi:DNA-binding transcriptional LysR family regulator
VRFGALQDSSLIARRLTTTQFNVVGSPRYFAKHGQPKTLKDLADHNCLAFASRDTRQIRDWRFATADGETTLTPNGTMTLTDGASMCDAAASGYGLAQLHTYYLDSAIAQKRLVRVLPQFNPRADPISLVYPQTRHLTPNVRAFVDFMVARFKPSAKNNA